MVIGIFMNRNKINKSIMSDKYTTETASIKATIGKFRKLDTDKLTIKGQDISSVITNSGNNILDERGTLANDEIDIWNSCVITDEEGNVIIKKEVEPKEHTLGSIIDDRQRILWRAAKIINN
jgi:hypothetical protein